MPKKLSKKLEHDLDAMDFAFGAKKWSIDNVFNFYYVAEKRSCKICDAWVERDLLQKHVDLHKKEMADLLKRRKAEAEKRRLEALALARIERKRLKEMEEWTQKQSKER